MALHAALIAVFFEYLPVFKWRFNFQGGKYSTTSKNPQKLIEKEIHQIINHTVRLSLSKPYSVFKSTCAILRQAANEDYKYMMIYHF